MNDGGGRERGRPAAPDFAAHRSSAPIDFRADHVRVRHPGAARDAPAALEDLSIEIRRGEQVAVVGASGAGKSTVLATLGLAREPHDGRLDVFGTTPWARPSAERHQLRRRLFLAPQLPPLPPRQRVVDAVLAGCVPRWSLTTAIGSLVRPKDARLAHDALARFDLEDKLFDRVDRLSGGERQRVALARLLVAEVDAYLVDEPLSALDPTLAGRSIAVLQEVAARRGATLVCSLHQVELALSLFPRIVGLRQGRVLFDRPRDRVHSALLDDLYGDARAGPSTTSTIEAWSLSATGVASADDVSPEAEAVKPARIADGSLL